MHINIKQPQINTCDNTETHDLHQANLTRKRMTRIKYNLRISTGYSQVEGSYEKKAPYP